MRETGMGGPLFRDRGDAGRQLAEALASRPMESPVVFAIPRGGIVVAAELARRLGAELDVVVARKLGAPYRPELAIGAVTAEGDTYLNSEVLRQLQVDDRYLQQVVRSEREEAHRREQRFRDDREPVDVRGRTAILVDDGLATGATMRAAARSLRRRGPGKLIIAVPVGSREACRDLRGEADDVVCLAQPEPFYAVGLHYADFEQVGDAEVVRTLAQQHLTRR